MSDEGDDPFDKQILLEENDAPSEVSDKDLKECLDDPIIGNESSANDLNTDRACVAVALEADERIEVKGYEDQLVVIDDMLTAAEKVEDQTVFLTLERCKRELLKRASGTKQINRSVARAVESLEDERQQRLHQRQLCLRKYKKARADSALTEDRAKLALAALVDAREKAREELKEEQRNKAIAGALKLFSKEDLGFGMERAGLAKHS